MEQRIHSRQFEVDMFEKDESTWSITSRLNDDIHDIRVILEITVPEMVVKQTSVEFIRYPLQECLVIPEKINGLVGANLFEDYSERVRNLFSGPQGCPNVMNLLTTSAPSIIYFYFPDLVKNGKIKPQQWWHLCGTRLINACIAHQLIAKKYSPNG